jgi:hypothetical protein
MWLLNSCVHISRVAINCLMTSWYYKWIRLKTANTVIPQNTCGSHLMLTRLFFMSLCTKEDYNRDLLPDYLVSCSMRKAPPLSHRLGYLWSCWSRHSSPNLCNHWDQHRSRRTEKGHYKFSLHLAVSMALKNDQIDIHIRLKTCV